jgi:hypothetical protein
MSEEIETGVETLKGLAEWILKQPDDMQERKIYLYSVDGCTRWDGVLEDHGPGFIVFSPNMTLAHYQALRLERAKEEAEYRSRHWNRPEVLEAKKKGLLP